MKARFNTIDIIAIKNELQNKVGMRVNQIYDIDSKTYLIKLVRSEEKTTILFESGIRIHTTEYEWPKNPAPSGFTMKLRKHLKNKRLEKVSQIGIDRIIDLQFGINEVACHIIIELYDRGNIALTDHEYVILNILRPRSIGNEDVKLAVRQHYPISSARQHSGALTIDSIKNILLNAKKGDNLKKAINPHVIYGSALMDHVFVKKGLSNYCVLGKNFDLDQHLTLLFDALNEAEMIINDLIKGKICQGYIIEKVEKAKSTENFEKEVVTFKDFCPIKFSQFENEPFQEYPSFDKAVDVYFSNMESQKIDMKTLQKEKEAYKKLDNIKNDHFQRLTALQKAQDQDCYKAQLIEMNLELVDNAILVIANAIATQASWSDISELIQEAQALGDPIACSIKSLKLETNHFVIALTDPYDYDSDENIEISRKPALVDIDIDLSAYANARKYYDKKKTAAKKEQKTIEASAKAYKSAEKKTKQALKEVAVTAHIIKSRKTFWFEKFFWFISSENYLVISGRDSQQNELLVKKYLKPGDLYVHADLHGASSVIIKNPSKNPVPPKTLNEAGTMAICYSSAWDSKIITSAWWVYNNQVSKTAPTGEYLTTGSFMIRGKKNYLPPAHLIMGYGFLFKLDEDSIERHRDERKVKTEDEPFQEADAMNKDDDEIDISDGSDHEDLADTTNKEAKNEQELDIDEESQMKDVNKETSNTETKDEQGLDIIEESQTEEVKESEVKDETTDSDDDSTENFPDTVVNLIGMDKKETRAVQDPKAVYHVDGEPIIIHQSKSKSASSKQIQKPDSLSNNEKSQDFIQDKQKQGLKRGQRSKLKKIKEKYKEQDEDERQMRLKILGVINESKKNKKSKEKEQASKAKQNRRSKGKSNFGVCLHSPDLLHIEDDAPLESEDKLPPPRNEDSDAEDGDDLSNITEDQKLLDSLTGSPSSEDTLLFALPVCAPYSSMQNYKFKVKVMPGTAKRGKAGKKALQMFIQDKSTAAREKDLLRSVKDQDISRNLPGKVKLAAPNLSKLK